MSTFKIITPKNVAIQAAFFNIKTIFIHFFDEIPEAFSTEDYNTGKSKGRN